MIVLRNRIELWTFATTSDGAGGSTAVYSKINDFWAKIKPLSGSRGIEGSAIELEQVYELWMRYEDYPPLNKKVKIRFENRAFTIHAFQIIEEKRKYFKIIVKEDSGRDNIIFDENYQPITDEYGHFVTTDDSQQGGTNNNIITDQNGVPIIDQNGNNLTI